MTRPFSLDFDDYEGNPGPPAAAGRFINTDWGRWTEAEPAGDVIAMAHYHPDADVQFFF